MDFKKKERTASSLNRTRIEYYYNICFCFVLFCFVLFACLFVSRCICTPLYRSSNHYFKHSVRETKISDVTSQKAGSVVIVVHCHGYDM